MARSGLAGLTEYGHQSFSDILSDISTGRKTISVYINAINNHIKKLEEKNLWKKQPFDFKSIINHALRHYQTTQEKLKSLHKELRSEVKANHITRLNRISQVASEINVDIGKYWNQDYEQHKNYDDPDFRIVEYLYADTRDAAAYLLDFANMAERLNDFVGKQKPKRKLELSHRLTLIAIGIAAIVMLFGNNLCSRIKINKGTISPNSSTGFVTDSTHLDTSKRVLKKNNLPTVPKKANAKDNVTINGNVAALHIGDNNYYAGQPILTDSMKQDIEKQIIQLRRDSGIKGDMIYVGKTASSNASKFQEDIDEYLTKKGYNVDHVYGTIHKPLKKYEVWLPKGVYTGKGVAVLFGIFD